MADVLVVDDHHLLATALGIALRQAGLDADVLTPRPLEALVDAVLARAPRVVLLDLDLGQHGDSTRIVAALTDGGVRVVVMTGTRDPLRIAAALEQGAVAHRGKSEGIDRLVDTIRQAGVCDGPLDPEVRVRLLEDLRRSRAATDRVRAPFARLTDRESMTLHGLCDGMTVREMATAWVVSEATVRSHVRGVLTKLGVKTQVAAVAAAVRSGWLDAAGSARSA